jgi:hypothetical protein
MPIFARLVVSVLVLASAASAADCPGRCPIPGGGSQATDCFAEFDGIVPNMPPTRPTYLRCTDGDPTCDADGVVDGVCTNMVSICFNNFDGRFPGCQPRRAHTFDVKGSIPSRPHYDPERYAMIEATSALLPTDDSACTPPLPWRVELRQKKGVYVPTTDILKTWSYGEVPLAPSRIDSDRVKVVCVPAAG